MIYCVLVNNIERLPLIKPVVLWNMSRHIRAFTLRNILPRETSTLAFLADASAKGGGRGALKNTFFSK